MGPSRKITRGAVWKPGQPTCNVWGCGRVPDAGGLRGYCVEHAIDVQQFRGWLRDSLEDALDAARHHVD